MDIMPMSMQAIVPRTSEATQVQHNMNQQTNIQQDFQAMRDKADVALKQKQVRTKDNAEDGRIRRDGNRGGNAYGGSSRQKKRRSETMLAEEEGENYAKDALRGNRIDISL